MGLFCYPAPDRDRNRTFHDLTKPRPMWYVREAMTLYVLECAGENDERYFYCGTSTDFGRRLAQHAAGLGANFTRRYPPIRIASTCVVPNESARQIERETTIRLGALFGPQRVNRPEPVSLHSPPPQTLAWGKRGPLARACGAFRRFAQAVAR